MIPTTPETIRAALSHLSPDLPRQEWVQIGMAVKDGLQGDGFDLFYSWSEQGATFDPRDCRSAWKSFRVGGPVTVGTLFGLARRNGWKPDSEARQETPAERRARIERRQALERQEAERRAKAERMAAQKAAALLQRTELAEHPYLKQRGFPDEKGLIAGSDLFIPMRDFQTRALLGCQRIRLVDNEWEKKMLPGQRAKGAVFAMGPPRPDFLVLCEGYATALSIHAALSRLCFKAGVVACFSAGNIQAVAPMVRGRCGVLADNDASGAGQRAAEATGLPWVMPPTVGWDANDQHRMAGLMALCGLAMELQRQL